MIGAIGLWRDRREKIRHKACIRGLYTKPAFRGCGIARRLLNAAIEEARIRTEVRLITPQASMRKISPPDRSMLPADFMPFGMERNSMYV